MNKKIEIPEGYEAKIEIPEGYEAKIENNNVIFILKESEDERIREWLIEMVEELRKANPTNAEHNGNCSEAIAYLEKQKETVKKMEMYFDEIKQPVWNIKCAVQGDILVADYGRDRPWIGMFKSFNDDKSFNVYCFLSSFSHTFITNYLSCNYNSTYNVRPATDREKLYFFSKMIENGYVWDDNKKELKKIVYGY